MGLILEAMHLDVPWYAMFVQLVVVNLGAMIPASPGGIGMIHYLSMLVLSLWIVDKACALSFAVVFHGLPYLLIMLLGTLCILREGLGSRWLFLLIDQRK